MNRSFQAQLCALIFFLVFIFLSCEQKVTDKKEQWAVVLNFFSPDTSYYDNMKNFPFPDSLRFATPDSFFVNQGRLPIINDSAIIFENTYRVNGEKICCRKDTLIVYSDSIKGKKYLFAIGEYITVFQSDSIVFTKLSPRKNPASIPLWGIKLNSPYPPSKFKNEYEKLGARFVKLDERFDEVSEQKWNDNDSIAVETIQFNNSNDRMVTAMSKDMNEAEVNSLIDDVISRIPNLKYEVGIQKDRDGNPLKIIRILYEGVSMSFTQINTKEYSFLMTDYFETIKLIIRNADTGYVFRDDVTIY